MPDNTVNESIHFAVCNFVYLDDNYNLHFPEGEIYMAFVPDFAYRINIPLIDWFPGTKLGYDAPAEIRELSDPHWFTFQPVHPFIQHIIAIIYFLLFSVCVSGNTMVIAIFLRPAARRKPSSFLVASLAFSDIIMIITQAPPLFLGALFSKYWPFGKTWCQIYAFAGGVAGCTSIWLVIFIGYDLYMHLSKRAQKQRGVTGKQACSMVIFSFLYSAATNCPPFFGWGAFKPEGMLISCSFDYLTRTPSNRAFVVYLTFFDFFLPFMPLMYLYFKICLEVLGYYHKQNKVMNTLGMPKHVVKRFGNQRLITPLVSQFPALFAKTASCLNPLLYTACHPNFSKKKIQKEREEEPYEYDGVSGHQEIPYDPEGTASVQA
ncbi:hypothetical protein TCAL_05859 [Tigriopus californicus]|uniref:G-protein coupled receptors family 1 profile domain-containing protein n=1 Tax=Tigriopus californicus TaxID=6832 RepID=A0A553N6V8_TIGCA|nr:hypothetical protein TCAL_05859 [Tigriopus californicus]